MDSRYLRYFVAVAEDLSFTKAADRLHTAQPSLSQQIRRLEEIVGTPLFERDKHHVELTEAGRVFLEEARKLLQGTDRAIALARQAARAEAGHLSIGVIPGAEDKMFRTVLKVLRSRCPDVQLSLRSLPSPEQLTALQNRQINVGFLRGPIDDPAVAWNVVLRNAMLAVVPAKHPLAKLERIPVQALARIPLVQVSHDIAPAVHDITNLVARRAGVEFHPGFVTDNVLATLNAVSCGLGFSLLPDYIQQVLPKTAVARPLDLEPMPELELLVAYRKDDKLSILRFFLSLLHELMPPDR